MHVPDHDTAALDAIKQYIADTRFDELVQLGDFLDLDSVSAHNKNKPLLIEGARLQYDLDAGNEVLDDLERAIRKQNSRATISILKGNHEWRLDRFLEQNPVLHGSLSVEEGLHLTSRNIRFVQCYPHGELYQVGDAFFFHGIFTSAYHARRHVDHYGVNVFYGHCFDSETEVLTSEGWKRRDQLTGNETVGTMNLNTDMFEWNAINKIVDSNGYDTMIAFENDYIDICVTPDHGLVNYNRSTKFSKEGPWALKTARETYGKYAEFVTAADRRPTTIEDFAGIAEPSAADLRVAAWICSRGAFKDKGAAVVFTFAANEGEMAEACVRAMVENGVPIERTRTETNYATVRAHIAAEHPLRNFLRFADRPTLSMSFARLSAPKIRLLLTALAEIRGAEFGDARAKHAEIITYNRETANNVQALAVMAGLTTVMKSSSVGSDRARHTITLVKDSHRTVVPEESRVVLSSVKSAVWCLSVDNGTLFVRRRGKVCLTQNTHDVSSYSKSIHGKGTTLVAQSFGCLCNYSPPYMIGRPDNWQQAFGVFWFRPNGWFNYTVVRIFEGGFIAPNGVYYQGTPQPAIVREPTFTHAQASHHIHLSPSTTRELVPEPVTTPIARTVYPAQGNARPELTAIERLEHDGFFVGPSKVTKTTPVAPLSPMTGEPELWFVERCTKRSDAFETTEDLFLSFRDWCGEHDATVTSLKEFVAFMDTKGVRVRPANKRGYRGVAISTAA